MAFSPLTTVIYKAGFGFNRSKNTLAQAEEDKNASAATNGARVAVTVASAVDPARKVLGVAENINHKQTGFLPMLKNLGLAANVVYAAGKVADAPAEKKDEALCGSAGNLGTMYLFETIYAKEVEKHKDVIDEYVKKITNPVATSAEKSNKKILKTAAKAIKSPKVKDIIVGIGFIAASLAGCAVGEWFGKTAYQEVIAKSDDNKQTVYATC